MVRQLLNLLTHFQTVNPPSAQLFLIFLPQKLQELSNRKSHFHIFCFKFHNKNMNFSITNYEGHSDELKLNCLKLYKWAMDHQMKSARIVIADQFYYEKTLEQRREILSAPHIKFLCKTIIFENTAYDSKFEGPFYPKYVAVMVQYIAKIHTQKFTKELRQFQQKNAPEKASKQYFHYRLVDEQISDQLTGYKHNGVVPVLMNQKMPILFSHRIKELTPQFFWMGGGHPWVKMRTSFEEFRKAYNDKFLVGDITFEFDQS